MQLLSERARISLVRSHARDSDGETWRIQALDRAIEAAGRGDG